MKKLIFSASLNSKLLLTAFFFLLLNTGYCQHERRPQGPPIFNQLLKEMDQNNDSKISILEASGKLKDDFGNVDTNNDGYITEEEFKKAPMPEGEHEINGVRGQEGQAPLHYSLDVNSMRGEALNLDHFISQNFVTEVQKELIQIGGVDLECYIIKTKSQATEHEMGPWCPSDTSELSENGGIWFENDSVFDVSGHFIAHLDEFYNDEKWNLYRKDGTIKVTSTKEGCLAAAKPNVEDQYNNYCVECLPEYFDHQVTTFVIPAIPVYQKESQPLGRSGVGIALNGVKFDPPAPTHAILRAHTIAPLDDHGGHVNPHGGYHYHAVTGSNLEIEQDLHSPLIGYAIDGFGIYALLDKNNNEPINLDECGGHFDDVRGYHYHAGAPGDNEIIKCLHGIPGYTSVEE